MRFPRPRTRRAWLLIGLAALLLAGAAGAWWYDRHYPWYHFRTVVPDAVYRAGQPGPDDVATAARCYGVKTIINLREDRGPWYEAEKAAAAKAGIELVDVPLAEGTPPSPEQVATLLALYDDPARRPILFHCEYGTVRSAAVEALYRMEVLNESNEEAWDEADAFGKDLETKYPKLVEFVRTYRPRGSK